MSNNDRYDLSDRLIHFFRPLIASDDSSPTLPENWGFGNIDEGEEYPAIFLLRCAIRHRKLWATWSYRKGNRTIYGPYPATCFTEMPLAAFIEASAKRSAKGQKISTYALMFKKKEVYELGARPVIYGLSDIGANLPTNNGGRERIINKKYLPLKEQYRYVTFNPASSSPIDWTHEREWRLPYYDDISEFTYKLEECGVVEFEEIPGHDIDSYSFSEIGVIVNKKTEIPLIIHDILSLVDRGIIDKGTYRYVICSEKIKDIVALRDPKNEKKLIEESIIDIDEFFYVDNKRDSDYLFFLRELEAKVEESEGEDEFGEFGGCWLWIYDNFHPFTRALINQGKITVNQDGKYLYFPSYFSDSRSLSQREKMVKKLSKLINKKFNVNCGYFSVLNSDDPDELPFYNDDVLDNSLHYNCTFDEF